jgi:membrane protein YqaA with SNARE-associated domain
MKKLVEAIESFAEALGGPGLALVAFLDSSFLSFPQANDLLVIWMVLRNRALMPYYAAMATLGSVAGCLVLHHLAARGGGAFLKRRMNTKRVDRAMGLIQRHGSMAVLIPSLLPPPAPFKLFVLLAGIAGVPRAKFALAVATGRGVRYFGQGLLAVWYGDQAVAFLKEHGRVTFLALGAAVIAGIVVYTLWRRSRQGPSPRTI